MNFLQCLLISLFRCFFISRLFHLQIDSRHLSAKSHQGRASFQLREDQLQDLISCRLALFQLRGKDLIGQRGRSAYIAETIF